jgi:type II secretory pathway component PulM
MHRRRRMRKGEKLKSRMHQRKPRKRRSPVLLVGSIIVKYRLMVFV